MIDEPRLVLAWVLVSLLLVVTVAKAVAGYHAASATSRLGSSAAQRGIAYGVMGPVVSYGLFVFAVFPIQVIGVGERQAAALCGMSLLAVTSIGMAWGWWRYDRALGALFSRNGERKEP